ncbi:MAG: hypothetical protein ACD_75C01138G0002 [uncultured bacterium]|nr:MAG: hypothetical protein ACD_75C01138G0002 [uncultured bacterium]
MDRFRRWAFFVRAEAALIHAAEQVENVNRAQVEYRFRQAKVTLLRIISGDHQQVPEQQTVPGKENTFHLVSIFVFAGEMYNDFKPHFPYFRAKDFRGKGRKASGIFGDAYRLDAAICGNLPGELQRARMFLAPAAPAGNKFKGQREMVWTQKRVLQS